MCNKVNEKEIERYKKANLIMDTLNELYPDPPIPLAHNNDYTLLVAVVLSAQSTDKKVNELTPELFKKASDANSMFNLGEDNIYKLIKELGLSKQKARYLHELSRIIGQKFSSKVPSSFKDLESLPGVGHKTASVVMAQAFGIPSFPVDTHIHRLSQRWGLTNGRNVLQTERDLKRIFPESQWNKLHLQFIYYGREFCSAKGCDGSLCRICKQLYPKRKGKFIHKKA